MCAARRETEHSETFAAHTEAQSLKKTDGHSEAHACMRTCAGMCMARGPLRGRVRVGAACAEEVSMHEVHRSARRGNKGGGGRRTPRSGMKHELRRGRQGVGGDAAHREGAMVPLRPQCVCQNLTSCSSLVNVAGGPFDRRTPSRVSRLQERCKGCRFATAAL